MRSARNALLVAWVAIAGCSVNTRGMPPNVESMKTTMADSNTGMGYGYTLFVRSTPLATVTGSASYVPGPQRALPAQANTIELRSSGNAPTLRMTTYDGGCTLDASLAHEFRRLMDEAFAMAATTHRWNSTRVALAFIPEGQGIARKRYALYAGRRPDFQFYFACRNASPARDQFAGFLTAMHELSHAAFHLTGIDRQPQWRPAGYGDELLAEGGPACVYRALRTSGDPSGLMAQLSEDDYFANHWETYREPQDVRAQWCSAWVEALHGK